MTSNTRYTCRGKEMMERKAERFRAHTKREKAIEIEKV